jgi:hypothetical protein
MLADETVYWIAVVFFFASVERGLALDNELALISITMIAVGVTCHYLKHSS